MAASLTAEPAQTQTEIEREFPHDPALQLVHLARKRLAAEAESAGLGYLEYVRRVARGESPSAMAPVRQAA